VFRFLATFKIYQIPGIPGIPSLDCDWPPHADRGTFFEDGFK